MTVSVAYCVCHPNSHDVAFPHMPSVHAAGHDMLMAAGIWR